MKKIWLVSIAVVLGLTTKTLVAHAQSTQFPRAGGSSCNPTTSSVTTWGRGTQGFYNSSTTANISVTCQLPIYGSSPTSATTTVNVARVFYNDNNGTSGKAVRCTAYLLGELGELGAGLSLGTKMSCSTPGGCTSPTNTFVGTGFWSGRARAATRAQPKSCSRARFPTSRSASRYRRS